MELFYSENTNISGDRIELDDFEKRHLRQVLRKKTGDVIDVTDGAGNVYRAEIIRISPDALLRVKEHRQIPRSSPEIALVVGFIKPNRLEILLEKGCELGIARFFLVKTRYSNYFSPNVDRFHKILRQAVKQSQQLYLPQIRLFESMNQFQDQLNNATLRLVATDPGKPSLLSELEASLRMGQTERILLFIGPEGGFSTDELKWFTNHGFLPVSLGSNRLRTETAGIAGASIIQMYINQQKEISLDT